MQISDIKPGDIISFEVYPSALYGAFINQVRVEADLTASVALLLGYDIVSLHATAYPSVPANTMPDDPFQYTYLLVETLNGSKLLIGTPWIRPDTITIASNQYITIVVPNAHVSDMALLRNAIEGVGKRVESMTIKGNS